MMRYFLLTVIAMVPVLILADPRPTRAEWVPVRDTTLVIAAGGPLDFSQLGPDEPAGAAGRVIADAAGHLALSTRAGSRVKFLCASLAWSSASGSYPDHATAELYATQLRLHGYNIARFHFTDLILMEGRSRDDDFNPEQLDRFRYLLAALKRQGIYWIIDAMSSQEGGIGDASPDRWRETGDLKLTVHFDPVARRQWSRLVQTLYGSVNPYTGVAPLADPALALVVLVNENAVEFTSMLSYGREKRAYPAKLVPLFNAWLARKYASRDLLRAAWPDLRAAEDAARGTVAFPQSWEERGPRMLETQLFLRSIEADTTAWMREEIRRLGYAGLVSMYNNRTQTALSFSRAALPVITANTYHDEVLTFDPGSTISQTSSFDGAVEYLRQIMGTRWLGRPFVVTEWNHLFWNQYRHEAGLAAPGYAALQDWDAICQHGPGPIDLDFAEPSPQKRAILPYGVGLDPIARASETLAALVFRRGDVAAAPHAVAIPFGTPDDMLGDGRDGVPDDVTTLGLLTRLGLEPDGATRGSPDVKGGVLAASGQPSPGGADWTVRLKELSRDQEARRLAGNIDLLRAGGTLPLGNTTEPGRYESETGQMRLDTRAGVMRIVTPRTEAVSYKVLSGPLRLGSLTIETSTGAAMVAVSALDGAVIAASRRLLIIIATDAMNTEMTFRDAQRRTIESFGRMPVLIKRETVRMRLASTTEGRWRLASLGLDGRRGDDLTLRMDGRVIEMTIDNAAARQGPTTFFLLERTD